VTDRNLSQDPGPETKGNGTWQRRVFLPLLVVTATVVVAGCFRDAAEAPPVRTGQFTPIEVPTSTPTPSPAVLGQDEPRLGMNVLAGQSSGSALTTSIQVLPANSVAAVAVPAAENISPTTQTRWVKNSTDTTLWSGPDADAYAFTDVPADSLFRVSGPEESGRLLVYYVGDGLFRASGSGWVDAAIVETVEAPAPGEVSAVDAEARQPLPVWVQAHKATTLWSGPDYKAVTLTELPQWTFLKVAGLERDGRLLVNYAGDYASRQPGIGWVDGSAVGPSGDPGVWVTNHRATALWSGTDDNAIKFTDLPQWTKLRIVQGAPAAADFLQVEFFGDGFSRQPGLAWVALKDIGPITPPVPLPSVKAPATTPQMEKYTFNSTSDFIQAVGTAAQKSQKLTGVPASVTVAQAILESDWGRSRLTRQANNLFGIKALGNTTGPAGVVFLATWEHTPDGDVIVQAPFRAYYTLEQSIDDHGKFFIRNRRYAAALADASDARAFAEDIQDAGYATDPSYAAKLIGLMDRYNLYRFDS
jgi:hypothetical protein